MKDCTEHATTLDDLPPNKRVNYAYGMVLGVDDFRQEQAHYEWKSAIANALLHGHGTVCGMAVTADPPAGGPDAEIRVASGCAVDAAGRWLWIAKTQCAHLSDWTRQNAGELETTAAGLRVAYVRICAKETPDDLIPLASSPCATEEESTHPSRIVETACAEFSATPPAVAGLDVAVARLLLLLDRVDIRDIPIGDSGDQTQTLLDMVPPLADEDPAGLTTDRLVIPRVAARRVMRQILVAWTTSVRCRTSAAGCFGDDGCVLAARLEFSLDANNHVMGAINIMQEGRPVLAPTRLLQELTGLAGGDGVGDVDTFATAYVANGSLIRVWIHHAAPLIIPADAVGISAENPAAGGGAFDVGVVSFSGPTAGVLEINLTNALPDQARVAIAFDASKIHEQGTGISLLSAIDDEGLNYIDRDGPKLIVRTVAELESAPAAVPALDQLSDVDAPAPPTGAVLVRDPDAWRARILKLDDLDDAVTPPGADGLVLVRRGNVWKPEAFPVAPVAPKNVVQTLMGQQPYAIVAAGEFMVVDGKFARPAMVFGDLKALLVSTNRTVYQLQFPFFTKHAKAGIDVQYIVKGTPIDTSGKTGGNAVFHVLGIVAPTGSEPGGINVRIGLAQPADPYSFMVEISVFGEKLDLK